MHSNAREAAQACPGGNVASPTPKTVGLAHHRRAAASAQLHLNVAWGVSKLAPVWPRGPCKAPACHPASRVRPGLAPQWQPEKHAPIGHFGGAMAEPSMAKGTLQGTCMPSGFQGKALGGAPMAAGGACIDW